MIRQQWSDDCPETELLKAFAFGRLAACDFEKVASHLPVCPDCESRIQSFDQSPDEIVNRLKSFQNEKDPGILSTRNLVGDCMENLMQSIESNSSSEFTADHGKHYSRQLSLGPCHLGRFKLLEELGCGSFGHVFRAHDCELDRIVALKIQRAGGIATADEEKRFLHEARSVARLKHPSIVALYETGVTDEGVCFLVTEFVDGETLESRLSSSQFDWKDTARLVHRLAEAVHYAHQEGVVHRDIKPSNILIDDQDMPHLADFGLAKRESPEATLTSDGRVIGTPAYMPPEHARGCSRDSDARSDIYSMGVILYEMLTGERPFQGTRRILLLQVLDEEPRPLRQLDEQIPRDLETICLKAMAKQPAKRYQSSAEFADDLNRFLKDEPINARPASYLDKLRRWSARYPFAVAVLVAILVSSMAGFVYLRSLNSWIVEEMALDNVRLYSDMLEEFNEYYSEIRGDFFEHSDDNSNANITGPPLPATMRIEVAERISCDDPDGMQARIFSPYAIRPELHPRDDFEKKTLEILNQRIAMKLAEHEKSLEFYEFQQIDNQPYLKFARGQLMTTSCIDCHNTHESSPKRDWQVGDLAGVFSLTRPLSNDVKRAQEGFRGASLLVITISLTLTVCGLVLAVRNRSRIR